MAFSLQDRKYMMMALELARQGLGKTRPNPLVGCIIVKRGKIVGKGFHKKFGGAHAEVNALRDAGNAAKGADVYVTLDPCCHVGKTGKCTDALIRAGVRRVISAMNDPHDLSHVSEKEMKKAGILFSRGLLGDEARALQQVFLKNVLHELPYVILKVATTLDGKIATSSGVSRGISGKDSRIAVHDLRGSVDAILTGSGTVRIDNPHLGVRYVKGKDPLRVLVDSRLSASLNAQIFRDANVVVFTTQYAPSARVSRLRARKIEVVVIGDDIEVNLNEVLKNLFHRGVYLLLIEAGSGLMTSLLRDKLVDRYIQFIAPVLLGGGHSPTSFEGEDPRDFSAMTRLIEPSFRQIGDDILVDGFLHRY